ncbi:MAG: class I SAM-dependent methyltransferase [Actinomycetota bacterium]
MTIEAHEKSRTTWNEMAPGWDHYQDYIWNTSKHVAGWLVDHADVREGETILDVAGGPGDNGFLAAERVGPSGKVIETDFAPEMVEVARRRAAERGLHQVETRVLDAQQMDLPSSAVDGVICRWAFMLMLDPQTALKECRRVLKDGRTLAFSVWGRPEQNPWVTVSGMTMVQMGYEPGGDPFGPGGMFSMADHDTIRSMVTAAGFQNVEIEEMPVHWTFESFDEAWDFIITVAGAIAVLVKELPEDEVARFRVALQENMKPFINPDGRIDEPGVTINVVAS